MLKAATMIVIGIVGAIALRVATMQSDEVKVQIKPEPTAKEQEESQKRREAEIAKRVEDEKMKEEKLTSSIMKSNNKQLVNLLDNCRSSIMDYARSSYKGPFNLYMIDVYSADIYQLMAGSHAIETDEDRIKKARKYYSTFHELDLNTEFAILYTVDSFSGPKKIAKKYKCKFSEGPKISEVSEIYEYN